MLTIILLIILAIVIGVAILLYTAPSSFRVERKILIQAKPDKIFPYLHSLRETTKWSPYENLDPNMERKFSGPDIGVGAKYEWTSKTNRAGAGIQEIIATEANQLVRIRIEFLRPMPGVNQIEYRLTEKNGGTEASWSMTGPMNAMSKIVCLFIPMDKMIGGQFAKGMASLKDLVEKGAA